MEVGISIVIPVYNSEGILDELYEKLSDAFKGLTGHYEIIMIDDASHDGSYDKMMKLHTLNKRVKIIQLERNFGQQNAIMCGLRYSSGDYVITMDDDLQHPPEEIYKLLGEIEKGFDAVYGIPVEKRHQTYRNMGTQAINCFFNMVMGKPKNIRISSFRIMKRRLVQEIVKADTSFVYISAELFHHTSNVGNVPVKHENRRRGRSNYNLLKLTRLFFKLFCYYSPVRVLWIGLPKPQYIVKDVHL